MNTNDLNGKYLVLTCKKGVIEQQVITRQKKLQLTQDPQDIDFLYDETRGQFVIRTHKNKLITGCGISSTNWELLENILYKAGELIELDSENYISATIRRIRSMFMDDKRGYFIESHREPSFAVRWNTNRSWRLIKPYEPDQKPKTNPPTES